MLTLQTMNNVLTQSSRQTSNEQTDYNYIINSVKTSVMMLIVNHLKDFFFQTLENAKMTVRVNQIYIINQIIIHKIRKFNDFNIFNSSKLSDFFFQYLFSV